MSRNVALAGDRGAWSARMLALLAVTAALFAFPGVASAIESTADVQPAPPPGPIATGSDARDLAPTGQPKRGSLCPGAQDPCWFEGVSEQSQFVLCPPLTGTGYVNTWTGYWISGNGGTPAIGDRYYGHIVAGVVGSACGGKFVDTEIILPGNTKLDLSNEPAGQVRCFYTSGQTGSTSEVTNDPDTFCKSYGPGAYGGVDLGGRIVPNFGTFEIIFPLRSNARLRGMGGNDKMVAAVETEQLNSLVAPEQFVTVVPPTIHVTGQRDGDNDRFDGTVGPAATGRAGAPVHLVFAKKKGTKFKPVDTGNVPIQDASGAFAATSPRPGSGKCKITASYPVKDPVVKASDGFSC